MQDSSRSKVPSLSEVKCATLHADGRLLLHRGDVSDVDAWTHVYPRSYESTLQQNWSRMFPLYRAAFGDVSDVSSAFCRDAYNAYDDFVACNQKLPTTGQLVDMCCKIAGIILLHQERLLHIRVLKELFAIDIDISDLKDLPPF